MMKSPSSTVEVLTCEKMERQPLPHEVVFSTFKVLVAKGPTMLVSGESKSKLPQSGPLFLDRLDRARPLLPEAFVVPILLSVADLDSSRRLRSEASFLDTLGVSHQVVLKACSFEEPLGSSFDLIFGVLKERTDKQLWSRFSFGVSRSV